MMNDEINILLMGQTGVGKSTFINAFLNSLYYDSFDAVMENGIKHLIPSSFIHMDNETFEEHRITIGTPDNNEDVDNHGHSSTQACRSYVLQLQNYRIRLIDVPGVGDTRGVVYDDRNFENILSFIRQYKYLNGICVLLKSDMKRLDLYFRYCITELLRHLHVNAKENLLFVFTHARSIFFQPGDSAQILRQYLKDLKSKTGVDIPFNRSNCFLLENETFRYLAIHDQISRRVTEEEENHRKSWEKSVQEYCRLIKRVLECRLHRVKDTESLNDAQNLIRRLARPVAETTRLIAENIDLAEQYKEQILHEKSEGFNKPLPQRTGRFVPLKKRMTVCISSSCTRIIEVDGDCIVDYHTRCHDGCQLRNAVQECIGDPVLRHCYAMKSDGFCKICTCEWTKHMHITYQFQKNLTYMDMIDKNSNQPPTSIICLIDQRIQDLRREADQMRKICVELSAFLKANAITVFNHDLLEYLHHQLKEEKAKRTIGVPNEDVIRNLEKMIENYQAELNAFKKFTSMESTKLFQHADRLQEIFALAKQLYDLPINGKSIREQVQGIEEGQLLDIQAQELFVDLRESRTTSKVRSTLETLINS